MQRRKRQINIDQFLREGLCPRSLVKSIDGKEGTVLIENALRIHSSGLRHHRIEFTESPEQLRVTELIDFTMFVDLCNFIFICNPELKCLIQRMHLLGRNRESSKVYF